jgi:adenylate cyclase
MMQQWRVFTSWLGSLPSPWVLMALAFAFMLWAVLDLLVLRASSGLASSTYDAMVRARIVAQAPDPRIVIVDIDEASLARMGKEFGRWPWPRDTLATVLTHIEKQQPAAIAWDVIFSDADRLSPGGDKAFDESVSRSPRSHFSVVRLPLMRRAS